MARTQIDDALWEIIEPLIPVRPRRKTHPGRRPIDNRACLEGIIFVLRTGIPWEDLPAQFGCSGMTCWRRLRDWNNAGVWRQLHLALLRKLRAADRIDLTRALVDSGAVRAEAMGKTALPANDRAGFVSNSVLMPMINEAFYAWMEGVAEPRDIDGIMKLGCNHPMGPLELADFIGLDTCAHIMNVLADGLHSERYRPCPKLEQLVVAGRMGRKTGRGVFEY